MVVSLILMGYAIQCWAPGFYIIAYVGGYVVSQYDDGIVRERKKTEQVL